jgi:hypothetical protein
MPYLLVDSYHGVDGEMTELITYPNFGNLSISKRNEL